MIAIAPAFVNQYDQQELVIMSNSNKGAVDPRSVGTWRLVQRIVEFQDTGESSRRCGMAA